MRRPIIIGNWKMNMKILQGLNFLEDLEDIAKQMDKDYVLFDIGVAPQSIALRPMRLSAEYILIGAQNCSEHLSGAYTGELSAELLSEVRINFCIVGHSERRQYFNETDEMVNEKAKILLEQGVMPVICVGETLEQYEAGQTKEVIENQVEIAMKDLAIEKCVIAYEPVWAIGTGKTATAQIAQDVCLLIRSKIAEMYDLEKANKVRIQYGGSVNPENIKELMDCPDIDGALVGGASLKLDSFEKLIKYKEA